MPSSKYKFPFSPMSSIGSIIHNLIAKKHILSVIDLSHRSGRISVPKGCFPAAPGSLGLENSQGKVQITKKSPSVFEPNQTQNNKRLKAVTKSCECQAERHDQKLPTLAPRDIHRRLALGQAQHLEPRGAVPGQRGHNAILSP